MERFIIKFKYFDDKIDNCLCLAFFCVVALYGQLSLKESLVFWMGTRQ